jgi:hypothetical protein
MNDMSAKTSSFRVFRGSFAEAWTLLQLFDTTSSKNIPDKKIFYLNTLYSVLIQIEYQPETRTPMFHSLIDFIHGAKNICSLETVFLTLLNHSQALNHESQNSLFQRGLKTWKKFAKSTQPVKDASLVAFYNVISKRMFTYSASTATELRNDHIDLSSSQDIGTLLEDNAEYIADQPFSPNAAENGMNFRRADGLRIIPALIIGGILLYALLHSDTARKIGVPEEQLADVAAIPIVIGSLRDDENLVEMVDKLKELDSTVTDLAEEKEIKGTSLVTDKEGHVNLMDEGASSSVK